jgi:hypothetical protein
MKLFPLLRNREDTANDTDDDITDLLPLTIVAFLLSWSKDTCVQCQTETTSGAIVNSDDVRTNRESHWYLGIIRIQSRWDGRFLSLVTMVRSALPSRSDTRIPFARWPEDAPHRDEDYLLSVLICNDRKSGEEAHYRWALHQGQNNSFCPVVFWRCVGGRFSLFS